MIIMYCTNNTIVIYCIFLIRKTLFAPQRNLTWPQTWNLVVMR